MTLKPTPGVVWDHRVEATPGPPLENKVSKGIDLETERKKKYQVADEIQLVFFKFPFIPQSPHVVDLVGISALGNMCCHPPTHQPPLVDL